MARRKTTMTEEHKVALAEGRELGRAVRAYLEALDENKPKRGRKRTPDSVKKRLATVTEELPSATGLRKVELIQERIDLEAELERMGTTVDLTEVEKGFVKTARKYGERKGISYAAWREAGVSAEVLQRAGITRGTRAS